MRVHGKIKSTTVNGPGDRSLIHVQGCSLKCSGCWNPETHNVDLSKKESDDSLFDWICENSVDGVTFSGGEPMQQAYELEDLIFRVKAASPKLSIGLYTGYTLKELDSGNYNVVEESISDMFGYYMSEVCTTSWNPWRSIKRVLDFAVMGRFNEQQLDTSKPLLTSRNQELVLFSDKYKQSDFKSQEIQFNLTSNGMIQITGFPVGLNDFLSERDW